MSGRDLFQRFRLPIAFLNQVLRWLPEFCTRFLWQLTKNMSGSVGTFLRFLIAKRLAKSCGDNVSIGPRCTIAHWENLSLGQNVSIHVSSYIDAVGGISIGENVSIAHSSSILSFEHTWDDRALPIKYNPLKLTPVVIADDVWIGCGCRILAGACIGERTIVAAGSVVTRGQIAAGLFGGTPAKKIREI